MLGPQHPLDCVFTFGSAGSTLGSAGLRSDVRLGENSQGAQIGQARPTSALRSAVAPDFSANAIPFERQGIGVPLAQAQLARSEAQGPEIRPVSEAAASPLSRVLATGRSIVSAASSIFGKTA